MPTNSGERRMADFVAKLGVVPIPPATCPFDPGYDLHTLEGHLAQSAHLMSRLKISMACWLIADEEITRQKIAAARRRGLSTVTGGGPFEIALAQGVLESYLDLCADLRVTRIECGEGFTQLSMSAARIVDGAHRRGLEVQFELGKKHDGPFSDTIVETLIERGTQWLDAGAAQLVIEARESARGVGLFDANGTFNARLADRFARAFGLATVEFEAPDKLSQFALLDHFGPDVHLCNVRLEEVLRVEIYRRGLHSDAFANPRLRPRMPVALAPSSTPR